MTKSTLNNGYTIIKANQTRMGEIILGEASWATHTPYVTWVADSKRSCFWGRYFETYTEAYNDFVRRSNRTK